MRREHGREDRRAQRRVDMRLAGQAEGHQRVAPVDRRRDRRTVAGGQQAPCEDRGQRLHREDARAQAVDAPGGCEMREREQGLRATGIDRAQGREVDRRDRCAAIRDQVWWHARCATGQRFGRDGVGVQSARHQGAVEEIAEVVVLQHRPGAKIRSAHEDAGERNGQGYAAGDGPVAHRPRGADHREPGYGKRHPEDERRRPVVARGQCGIAMAKRQRGLRRDREAERGRQRQAVPPARGPRHHGLATLLPSSWPQASSKGCACPGAPSLTSARPSAVQRKMPPRRL